jgi:hypothetical protein
VLLNVVLDALLSNAMGALALPSGVIAALDKLRPAFLWAAVPCVWHPVPGGMGHGVKIQGEGGLGCARSSPRTLASR